MKPKGWYVPMTPAGSLLPHLRATDEKKAWNKLMKDAAHMPYKGLNAFKQRGYAVIQMKMED